MILRKKVSPKLRWMYIRKEKDMSTNDSQVDAFDVMEDKPCNNYIGSKSTWENLKLIPADKRPILNSLHESDRERIMEGLDGIISGALQDKIWEMIWKRWCAYEDFCNS